MVLCSDHGYLLKFWCAKKIVDLSELHYLPIQLWTVCGFMEITGVLWKSQELHNVLSSLQNGKSLKHFISFICKYGNV